MIDFNEELARATLLEHPNSFFLGTAGAEDVDSDSGYSSPQHRQTTAAPSDTTTAASVAVGPQRIIVSAPPQPASRVLETTHTIQQQALVTYVPDGRHLPMMYAPYPFQGPPSVKMFVPTGKEPEVAVAAGDSSKPKSGAHRNSKTRRRKAAKQKSDLQAKSAVNSQATGGVTSCSEPALPFDDVDEFPYLLSAADGLIASQCVASGPQLSSGRPVEVSDENLHTTSHLP